MTLPIMFLALAGGLAVLLYAVTLFLQGYFYNTPASKLPLRALVGGIVAAGFLVLWVKLNTGASTKDKYGTLFEFNASPTREFNEFTSIRRHVNGKESRVKYTKNKNTFLENNDPSKPFRMTTSDYLTVAIEIPDGDKPARVDAELFVPSDKPGELRPWKDGDTAPPTYSRDVVRTFREPGGRRSVEFSTNGSPGPLQMPSRGAFFGAIMMNIAHLVVWFIVFYPILKYTPGTAFGLAAAMTVVVMLFAMPVLFDRFKPTLAQPALTAFNGPVVNEVTPS